MRLNRGIRLKLISAFVCTNIAVAAIFAVFSGIKESKSLKEGIIREGDTISGLLANNVKLGIMSENRAELKDASRGVFDTDNVLAVEICGAEGKPLFVSSKPSYKKPEGELCNKTDSKALYLGGFFVAIDAPDAIRILKAVKMETNYRIPEGLYIDKEREKKIESVIGHIEIALSKRSLRREVYSIVLNNTLMALALMIAGMAIVCLIIKRILAPLSKLTAAAEKIGMSSEYICVPVTSEDEIGKLAEAFNTMVANLRKREEDGKLLEERLSHAKKMEVVGKLARGIAHDFNNILTVLKSSAHVVVKKIGAQSDESLTIHTACINDAVSKAAALVQELVVFSREQAILKNPIDINELIRNAGPLLKNIAGEEMDFRLSLCPEPLVVIVDSHKIERILMNLTANARDATKNKPSGRWIEVVTDKTVIAANGTTNNVELNIKPGEYAVISIADNGDGMTKDVRERIFEPFFSTKGQGKGFGLGLSIVSALVEMHQGYINVDAGSSEGSVFTFMLPMNKE